MSKKRQNQIRVRFIGTNNEEVTGSMILIEFGDRKILLEAGLYQSNNLRKDFEINSRRLDFKPKDIDTVFINHVHIDHLGLLPRLYAEGCKARIVMVKDSTKLANTLLLDSAHIMQRDVETLNRKNKGNYKSIYVNEDVEACMNYVEEFDFNKQYILDENLSFEFIKSGHIIRSAQLILQIKEGNTIKRIAYTSDLGNLKVEKYYTEKFEPIKNANLVIAESTYSNKERTIKPKDRIKDLEKIKSVISETCIERDGRVLIPTFSLDRTQNILTHLYKLFGEDEKFDIPIIVDSPLSMKLTDIYKEILTGEDKELFNKVLNWKNLRIIKDSEDSKVCVSDMSPKVVISSSGMLTAGRSIHYTKNLLPDKKAVILFIGFCTEGSLAGKIKNDIRHKTITIDNKPYKNNCGIVSLSSFTSHIQFDDMLDYYSEINCEKIALVHGNFREKCGFSEELQKELSRKNKTTKVICVNKSTEICL